VSYEIGPAVSLCSIVTPFYQLKLLQVLMRECADGLARELLISLFDGSLPREFLSKLREE
jgi:hypothetical protein